VSSPFSLEAQRARAQCLTPRNGPAALPREQRWLGCQGTDSAGRSIACARARRSCDSDHERWHSDMPSKDIKIPRAEVALVQA